MNSFDRLPTDVKLHLFSFLKTNDVVAVTSVNRTNRKLDKLTKLWQKRTLKDYSMLTPPDTDAKEFYQALRRQYLDEFRVSKLLWVIQACSQPINPITNPIRGLIDPPVFNMQEYMAAMNNLLTSLIIYPRATFIQQAESMIARFLVHPDRDFDIDTFYNLFVSNDPDEILYYQECLTDELYACSDHDARLHLRDLIHHAPKTLLTNIVSNPEHSSKLFFIALRYGNVDMIQALLDLGMNPNHIQKRARSAYYRPLDAAIVDLQSCTGIMSRIIVRADAVKVDELQQYYLHRINCFEEIFDALLAHGADPDSLSIEGHLRMPSPRTHAATCLQEVIAKGDSWHPHEVPEHLVATINNMLEAAKTILKIVIDSPKLINIAEPVNKRMRI